MFKLGRHEQHVQTGSHIMVNVLKFCTKVSDKMVYANNADPAQTVPEGAV